MPVCDDTIERRETDLFQRQATALSGDYWPALPPQGAGASADAADTAGAPAHLPPPSWVGTPGEAALGASVGTYETAGQRSEMEDADLVIPCLGGAPGATLCAVFDGHRGPEAAFFLRSHLRKHLEDRWSGSASAEELLAGALLDADAAFNAEWDGRLKSAGAAPAGSNRYPGSTALVALVYPSAAGGWRLALANLGDSRAVVCQGGQAIAVTSDHTGKRIDERERVHKAGAGVRYMAGAWRFGKQGLAVSRSVGDADMKGIGIIAQAETSDSELDGAQQFVILASDGMWDMMSNEEAVALVQGFAGSETPAVCAERLVREALDRGSTDNTTAVVAFLPCGSTAGSGS